MTETTKTINVASFKAIFGTEEPFRSASLSIQGNLDGNPIVLEMYKKPDNTVVKTLWDYESGVDGLPIAVAATIKKVGEETKLSERNGIDE
jgi:hypothetical protein